MMYTDAKCITPRGSYTQIPERKEVNGMSDHEHEELESKIRSLEHKIGDLDYDLRRAKDDLQTQIWHKADKDHSHES